MNGAAVIVVEDRGRRYPAFGMNWDTLRVFPVIGRDVAQPYLGNASWQLADQVLSHSVSQRWQG